MAEALVRLVPVAERSMALHDELRRRIAELQARVGELEADIESARVIFKVEKVESQTLVNVIERMALVARQRERIDQLRFCFDSGVVSTINYLRDHGYDVPDPKIQNLEGRP